MALAKNRFNDTARSVQVTNLLPQKLVTKGKVTLAKGQEAVVVKMMVDGQYAEPIVALVRELISNGADAVAALRGLRPGTIAVSSPTALSPQFVVKDNGVGMTLEEVVDNYATLLGSLKGDDLSQIGAYGLGAKAPLAYTTSFVIRTVKDGMRTVFTLSCGAEGYDYDVMEYAPTDEESGTTVTVPVRSEDFLKFEEALSHYRGMPAPTSGAVITCDGKPFTDDSKWFHYTDVVLDPDSGLKGRIMLSLGKEGKHSLVEDLFNSGQFPTSYILGGYHYATDATRYRGTDFTGHALVELVPGVVDFTTSRDNIVTNDRFYELQRRVQEAETNAPLTVIRDLLLSLTPDEMLKLQESWHWQREVFVKDDEVTLSTALGKLTMAVEDFTLPNGGNIFRYQREANKLEAYYLLDITGGYKPYYRGRKTASTFRYASGVNACMGELTTQVVEGAAHKLDDQLKDLFKGHRSVIMLLEEVDEEVVKAFRRERSHLLADDKLKPVTLFLKGALPATFKHELTLVQEAGLSRVEVLSRAAFLKMAEESKVAHRRIAAPREKRETYPFTMLLEKAAPLEKLAVTDITDTEVELSPQEALAAEDTLLLFHDGDASVLSSQRGKQTVLHTLYGLENGEVEVKGKRVLAFHPSSLPSPISRKLGTTDHSYALVFNERSTASQRKKCRVMDLSHKWVQEKVDATPLPATHYLKNTGEEELRGFMLALLRRKLGWRYEASFLLPHLKLVLPSLEEGPLKTVITLLTDDEKAWKQSSVAATPPHEETVALLLGKLKGTEVGTTFTSFLALVSLMTMGYFRNDSMDLQFLAPLLMGKLSSKVPQAALLAQVGPLLQQEVDKLAQQEG